MNEQQRVFLAISLCLAILIGWQYFFAPAPMEPRIQDDFATQKNEAPKEAIKTKATKDTAPAAESPGAAEGQDPSVVEEANAPSAEEVAVVVPVETKAFDTDLYKASIVNNLSIGDSDKKNVLGLTQLELLEYKEAKEEGQSPALVNLVDQYDTGERRQALIQWHLGEYDAPRMQEDKTADALTFRGKSPKGLHTEVIITPDESSYAMHYKLRVLNRSLVTLPVDATLILALQQDGDLGSASMFAAATAQPMTGRCLLNEDIEEFDINELQEKRDEENSDWRSEGKKNLHWAGIDRQYFVLAAAPAKPDLAKCSMTAYAGHLEVKVHFAQELVAPDGDWSAEFSLYAGPKKVERLEEVQKELGSFVDYNIMGLPLGFLARPMIYSLNVFHGWTASWGIAIILLTFFVKAILLPVTIKSTISMRKMQLLRPELDKLKARFGSDRERMNVEQMKLFKEKNVNPLGGCLPMLLQMPVWFALYRSLWSAVDIYQQSFAWIPDLTAKEPFPFMAIAIGGLTVLQQKLTPTSVDNAQARMMMIIMPIMLMVFMIALPSGLVLYILVNSVLTLFQQLIINNMKITI